MPGWKQAWPNSAACWSPAMPAIGTSAPSTAGSVVATTPLDGTDLRQHLVAGRRAGASSSASQRRRVDVEQQRARGVGVVGDVGAAAGELPDQPAVDRCRRRGSAARGAGRARCRTASAAWCRRSRDRSPGRSWRAPSPRAPSAFRRAHRSAVRRSCQTMARCTGRPVRAVPEHRRLALVGDADRRQVARGLSFAARSAALITFRLTVQISSGSCSTQPGADSTG